MLPGNGRKGVPHPGSLFRVLDRAYPVAVDRRGHEFRPIPCAGPHGSQRQHGKRGIEMAACRSLW